MARKNQPQRQTPKAPLAVPPSEPLRLPDWWAPIIFFLTTLIFFHPQILGTSFFWEDFTEEIFPKVSFAARHLANFDLPFWNPYTFCGMPYLADSNAGLFYPFNMLLSLFVSNGRLPVLALELVIILHIFIAQMAMFFLARRLFKMSFLAAIFSAISYAFSGALVCRMIHPVILYQYAWFPLLFYFFHDAVSNTRARSAIIAGAILFVSMTAGHPQIVLFINFYMALLAAWLIGADLRKKESSWSGLAKKIGAAALPFFVGIGLYAIQLIPTLEFSALSPRNEMTYQDATVVSFQIKQLLTMIVPRLFGFTGGSSAGEPAMYIGQYYYYWETAFYFGIPAFMLSIAGLADQRKTRTGAFLAAIAAFGFLFAIGGNGFLFRLFHELPLFDKFRNPSRIIFYATFSFTLFAGMGFDALLTNKRETLSRAVLFFGVLVPGCIALGTLAGIFPSLFDAPQQYHAALQQYGLYATLFFGFAFALMYLVRHKGLPAHIGGGSLIVLLFIELYANGVAFNNGSVNPADMFVIAGDLEKKLTPQPPNDLFRVKMREGGFMVMRRNQGFIDPIMLIEGYSQLNLVVKTVPAPDTRTSLDLLNVRYEIMVDEKYKRAYFAERPGYFPRARMFYNAVILDSSNVAQTMQSGMVDLRKSVMLEKGPGLVLDAPDTLSVKNTVICTQYQEDSFTYTVETEKNGIFWMSELWYPAWKAYVDGKPAELLRADNSFRAVALTAGSHTVELRYESRAFKIGALIAAITAAVCIMVLLVLRRKKTSPPDPA